MKFRNLFIATITVLVLTSCTTTSTRMTETWKSPDIEAQSFKNLLVLGVSQDGVDRRMFESSMAEALSKAGARSTASYTVLPDETKLNESAVSEVVKKYKYDGVIVTKLLAVSTDTKHVPARSYVQPYQAGYPSAYYGSGYNGFYASGYYNHYAASYTVVNEPAYNITTKTAVIETNLYDVETEKLVWSGRSATINPLSAGDAIPSITSAIAKKLKEEKIIRN